jgi:gamma-glutamyltranspeptidase/glutathione hydrolase
MLSDLDYPFPWQVGIRPSTRIPTRRNLAAGYRGMAATGHPLATSVALKVLGLGGNAVDAAVAAGGMLAVAQPMMSGMGGDVFLIYYDARACRLWAINGSGPAPAAATRNWYFAAGFDAIPMEGMLSVTVPGAVSAYCEALQRWGTMPLTDLWRPAIWYAEEGVPVAETVAEWIGWTSQRLQRFEESARIYLPDGRVPRVGDRLVQGDLAATLSRIANGGRDVLYRGEIATRIVEHSKARGALLGFEDLASYASLVYEPITIEYRGCSVFVTAPPSQGFILLEMLNLMEEFDLRAAGRDSADAVHIMVEAKKIAFADRDAFFGDPLFHETPLARVLSKAYAKARRSEIDLSVAAGIHPGSASSGGDTTYLCVVDDRGNAVSLVASLSWPFGCADVVPGTGIFLTNRAAQSFNLIEGHPNCIEPGKRPMHTLTCFVVMRGERLYLVGGTPGGDAQPQWSAQVLSNILDHDMTIQEAVEAPRWMSLPGTEPGYRQRRPVVVMEESYHPAVLRELERRGHKVIVVPYLSLGSGFQLIEADSGRGVLFGSTDPRGEGIALGR